MELVRKISGKFNKISRYLSVYAILMLICYFGFEDARMYESIFLASTRVLASFGLISLILRYVEQKINWNFWIIFYDLLFASFFSLIAFDYFNGNEGVNIAFLILFFVREASSFRIKYSKIGFNPGQLFIISFIVIILLGGLLLKLPNATTSNISFVDAFFTSTSAVCVTGLAVQDTQADFTLFGQSIILLLIQIGGLGIMTFASYFSFFFKGSSSFENRLLFGGMSNQNELNNVFSSLKSVLALTLILEATGIVAIYFSYASEDFSSINEHVYYSIFHGISAFNNAGFSLYSDSLYDSHVLFNYPFQLVISLLIIFGGLGFPIMQNVVNLFFYRVKLFFSKLFSKQKPIYRAWIINLNTKIILVTTGVLILFGTVTISLFEWNGVLEEHGPVGKLVIAFCGSVSPRTAGFNSYDMQELALPTILIILFLMWIGASPASTGGGIKTSTFYIGILTTFSMARSQDRIEFNNREVSATTIKRAFVIIFLSILAICLISFLLILLEPGFSPLKLVFECVSAFSTAGLSLGITSSLGDYSKLLIMLTMFIGRVSTLTILIALFRQIKQKSYNYPKEEVLIN